MSLSDHGNYGGAAYSITSSPRSFGSSLLVNELKREPPDEKKARAICIDAVASPRTISQQQ
jgi:hypothetical protein